MGTSVRPSGSGLEVGGHLTTGLVSAPHSATDGPSPKTLVDRIYPFPACRKRLRGWGRKRSGDPKGQRIREEELEERPGGRTSRKASEAGELLGEGGGQAGGWTGEVWRDSGPRQLSALGREGKEGAREWLPS